jgi:hypothetical protein
MNAPLPVTVDREAVALLELAARQLRQAVEELGPAGLPHSLLFLADHLEWACEQGADALAVKLARHGAYRARCCDLAEAFPRLNPGFAVPVHDGCWPGRLDLRGSDGRRQHQAQRRELALALGQRAADLLCPPPAADDGRGGEAA